MVLTKLDGTAKGGIALAIHREVQLPIKFIGTGETATPEQAQEAAASIRDRLRNRHGSAADALRILYGGSVKPDNASTLLRLDDVDGVLVGGASLDPEAFSAIARAGLGG